MRRVLAVLVVAGVLTSCGSGFTGRFRTDPGSAYGFDFLGDGTLISHAGGDSMRGTFTVAGKTVTICIGPMCRDLHLVGDCLLDTTDGGDYCKEPG